MHGRLIRHFHVVCCLLVCFRGGGGGEAGALVFEVGYHPRKKSRNLGLFFRTRQCTRVHRLGVQNRAKLGKNGVFLVIDKFWKRHDGQI